jgi:dienelactone hydrolase
MFSNIKEFPKPIGSYLVGITEMQFTDESRIGLFDFDPDEARIIPTTIFYPADSDCGKPTSPYAFPAAIEALRKSALNLISPNIAQIKTHCFRDVEMSNRQKDFPVIFFNPGYFGYAMQNTVLCSDLASIGYIVIAVDHPYEAGAVRYQDGTIIRSSQYLLDQFKLTMNPEARKKFKEIMEKAYTDEELIPIVTDFFEGFKTSTVWNNVKIWADDTRFVADQLEKINSGTIPSTFKGKLNLGKGYGITGHSYGGCTALQVCLDDQRFVCGVNIDAPTYGDYWNQDIQKPILTIGSKITDFVSKTPFIYNSMDAYMVKIDQTEHMDFTDYNYFARQLKYLKLLGKRDRDLIRDVLTEYHKAFFAKYLLADDKTSLSELKYDGVHIQSK